jgi:glycosyltransferase involved in cell wall biosynthesis
MPKVTVIIAAYNCSHLLRLGLASVLAQTYTDFEVWVVGDCCADDSEQVVASFRDPRLHWFNLLQRVGSQSGPNNEGLQRAQGEYIAYLGQDDLWFPWHLESLVTTIEETSADFVHALIAVMRPDRGPEAFGGPGAANSNRCSFVPPSGWLHRRKLIERCGFWPIPGMLIGGVDLVLQRRAFLAGCLFAGTSQLSVIKFPSPFWKTYVRSDRNPQQMYFGRLQNDPAGLQRELLAELVAEAVRRRENPQLRVLLRSFLKEVFWRVVDGYGRDRWPVIAFLRWREQRSRRRNLLLRGLSR